MRKVKNFNCPRFDRGLVANVLEFWRIPGYAIDYCTVFTINPAPLEQQSSTSSTATSAATSGSSAELTQVNIDRQFMQTGNLSRSSSQGLPSIDLEMQQRHRGDSTDSSDTADQIF